MENVTPELNQLLTQAYDAIEPMRELTGARAAIHQGRLIVRLYSQKKNDIPILPVPYQIFRFDQRSAALTDASEEERQNFKIEKYK